MVWRSWRTTPCWVRRQVTRWVVHVAALLPSVYGPRGMIMLGKAMVCLCFGCIYVGNAGNGDSSGVWMVTRIMPIQFWGVAWFLVAFMLISSAFKVDHSRALGALTAMFSLWGLSHLEFYLRLPVLANGSPNRAYIFSVIMFGLAISAAGVARMLNQGRTHTELVEKPGAP